MICRRVVARSPSLFGRTVALVVESTVIKRRTLRSRRRRQVNPLAARWNTISSESRTATKMQQISVEALLMNFKKKAVLDRIRHLEDEITKGREYLENGSHAHWQGFRPLFLYNDLLAIIHNTDDVDSLQN